MDIAFRVRNVEVPDSLRRVTLAKVTRLGDWCGIDRADVCFSEERNPRIAEREVCEITLFGQGRVIRAQAAATEAAVAADRVVGKLQQRAERFRGRSAARRNSRWCPPVIRCPSDHGGSVHFGANWSTARTTPDVVDQAVGPAGEAADEGFSDSRESLTPEDAALEMGERGSDIFFFVNAETGRPAVVYRRRDGNVALLDAALALPPLTAAARAAAFTSASVAASAGNGRSEAVT
jgi:putative sigma-54 modulation protein